MVLINFLLHILHTLDYAWRHESDLEFGNQLRWLLLSSRTIRVIILMADHVDRLIFIHKLSFEIYRINHANHHLLCVSGQLIMKASSAIPKPVFCKKTIDLGYYFDTTIVTVELLMGSRGVFTWWRWQQRLTLCYLVVW